jgi:hypothetical protein
MTQPDYQWPVAVLRPLLTELQQAHRNLRNRGYTEERLRQWCIPLQDRAVSEFAAANGWQVSPRPFSLDLFCGQPIKHRHGPAHFLTSDGGPVAVIVHIYKDTPSVEGVRVDRLPESWYWPGTDQTWLIRAPERAS